MLLHDPTTRKITSSKPAVTCRPDGFSNDQNHFPPVLVIRCKLLHASKCLQSSLSPLLIADTTLAPCHINVSSLALPGSATNHILKTTHGAWLMSKNYFKINILFSRFLISIAFSFRAPSIQRRVVLAARKRLHDSIPFSSERTNGEWMT
jgi:hypothetical protein